jgi:hypothetical protein
MLSKLILLLLGCVFCFTGANAQAKQSSWQLVKSAEGKFTVSMPCKPVIETQPADGDVAAQVYHSCSNEAGRFVVTYSDFGTVLDSKSMLDAYSEGTLSGGTLISKKPLLLGRIPGRELVLSSCDENAAIVYKWHIYHVGKRIYAITAGSQNPVDAAADITKFLSSFAIQR